VGKVSDASFDLFRICILDPVDQRKNLAQTLQGTLVLTISDPLRIIITQPSHNPSFGTRRIMMYTTHIATFGSSTVTNRIGNEGRRREMETE